MERESFIFYQSFWNGTKHLPNDNQKNCLVMIVQYGIDGIEPNPEIDPIAYGMFLMAKPQLDKNNTRYVNGGGGGRPVKNGNLKPKTKQEPNNNQTITKHKPNVNVNVNDNVNDIHTPPVELEIFIASWNKVKAIGDKKGLPEVKKITDKMKAQWKVTMKNYTIEEVKEGAKNYCKEIKSRIDDGKGYINHRFTLLEFLKQGNGLEKFINN